ncbi:MAG TPA: hypothetical protein VHR45_21615 [Thermoanaerobaculia bacterium]|nr:hypothetical protein [Thermoanaerobaculia bacterium]
MPSLPESIPPPDVTKYSETIRRDLYERTVAVHWPEHPASPDDFVPDYSPEDAGLTVWWLWGRYFAVWMPLEDLGEPSLPPWRRWVVVRIDAAPAAPYGVVFHEV